MNDEPAWKLSGTTATLTTERLEAAVDTQRPDLGLGAITARVDGLEVHFEHTRILGLSAGRCDQESVESTDFYERGDDLIVTCRPTATPAVGLQIYWRVLRHAPPQATGIETILSAQTDLLDSDPAATVTSLLPRGQVLTMKAADEPVFQPLAVESGPPAASGGAMLIRPDHHEISILQMVHPADDHGATIARVDGHLACCYLVLSDRLEKGVIRRSRLQTMFLPRENDSALAVDLYQQFASSPLPLTT